MGIDTAKIDYRIPDDLVSKSADRMLCHSGEYELTFFFFQLQPPIVLGPPEEVRKQLEAIKSIPANYVTSVVVAIDRMPAFMKMIQHAYEAAKGRRTVIKGE